MSDRRFLVTLEHVRHVYRAVCGQMQFASLLAEVHSQGTNPVTSAQQPKDWHGVSMARVFLCCSMQSVMISIRTRFSGQASSRLKKSAQGPCRLLQAKLHEVQCQCDVNSLTWTWALCTSRKDRICIRRIMAGGVCTCCSLVVLGLNDSVAGSMHVDSVIGTSSADCDRIDLSQANPRRELKQRATGDFSGSQMDLRKCKFVAGVDGTVGGGRERHMMMDRNWKGKDGGR